MKEESKTLSIGQAIDAAVEFVAQGNYPSAIGLLRGVLVHEPNNVEALSRLGAALFETRQVYEALYYFWRAMKLDRKSPMTLSNYGLALGQLGHADESLPYLERAIANAMRKDKTAPEYMALLHNNLGNTLERLGRYKDALPALDTAITYNPLDHFPHYNRGIVLLRLNRQEEALQSLNKCIALRKEDADAHYNRGMARLLLGDLKGGFKDYEYRLVTTENKVPNFGLPAEKKLPSLDAATGKTVLVYCEQGLGDDIQFFRFLPQLKQAAKIKMVTHTATRDLIPGGMNIETLKAGEALGNFDYWVALMSLPMLMGIENERQIPPPLLGFDDKVFDAECDRWLEFMKPHEGRRIGVCWSGNFQHKNDAHRSIDLATFARLFDVPGCQFYVLHHLRPGEAEQLDAIRKTHSNVHLLEFEDFQSTAAAVAMLDLVITVDTSIAHLAGSMGVNTQVLLPKFGTDWRWQLSRADSPWYPEVQLVRQNKIGEWAPVIDALAKSLTIPPASNQERAA